jgi:glycosyltransferase involved in cell wall biosynthesis
MTATNAAGNSRYRDETTTDVRLSDAKSGGPDTESPDTDGPSVTMVATPDDGTCGIGTYAGDLLTSFPDAIDTTTMTFDQDDRSVGHFLSLAIRLLASDTDVVHVQHEYGLFRREDSQWPGVMGLVFFPVLFGLNGLLGKTIVVTMHSVLKPDAEEAPLRIRLYLIAMHELIAAGSDHLVFLSEECENRFRADVHLEPEECSVLPHGVNLTEASSLSIAKSKARLGYDDDDTVVMIPGFMRPPKGHDIFIEVASNLPEYEFLVAGGGRPKGDDIEYAEHIEAEAPDNVTVTGVLDGQAFPDTLNAADLALLPYRTVSQSGTFNWCVAHAIPVVTSDEPYFARIEREWGCLETVDVIDVDRVTETVRKVLDSEDRQKSIAENARYFRRQHSFERVADRHYRIYTGDVDRTTPGHRDTPIEAA